jgi:hypothetical protein
MVGEAAQLEQRFQAAIHGVELRDGAGGGQAGGGIRGFHDRIKQRWKR